MKKQSENTPNDWSRPLLKLVSMTIKLWISQRKDNLHTNRHALRDGCIRTDLESCPSNINYGNLTV